MNPDEVLDALVQWNGIPVEAIGHARRMRDEMVPLLLGQINRYTECIRKEVAFGQRIG